MAVLVAREGARGRAVPFVPKPLSLRPFRVALAWQLAATLVVAAVAFAWVGFHGMLSAVLGGAINLSAGVVYAFALALSPSRTAGATVATLFRAEAAKILVIVALLWLVLSTYREVVLPALLAAFIVTVLLFRVALFVRD